MAAKLLDYLSLQVRVGISTEELNTISVEWAKKHGVFHAPLNYNGFPKSICTSLNNVVCHGIPNSQTIIASGDILNIDVTLYYEGYYGDVSRTFLIGDVSRSASLLVERAEKAMWLGIEAIRPGGYINEISNAIADYIEPFGYGIVTQLGGHGVGKAFHESPFVAYHRQRSKGVQLRPGMTFTVEPMINEGSSEVFTDAEDGWTVYTKDDALSAQFEHTVAVTPHGVEVLTKSS